MNTNSDRYTVEQIETQADMVSETGLYNRRRARSILQYAAAEIQTLTTALSECRMDVSRWKALADAAVLLNQVSISSEERRDRLNEAIARSETNDDA